MDYTADIMPLAILTQPSKTDVWGNPLTTDREHVPGLAFSPIGLRMMWIDGKRIKPYFFIKGGLIGFTKKALSKNAIVRKLHASRKPGRSIQTDRPMGFSHRVPLFSFFGWVYRKRAIRDSTR